MEPTSQEVLALIERGDLTAAEKLLWQSGTSLDSLFSMAPQVESAGDRYAKTDKDRALWCYEQAKSLYESICASATSGGEGMALQMENYGGHLGKKIWMLR